MVFDIRKSSDWSYCETKEINSLYVLLEFLMESHADEIVLGVNKGYPEHCKNEYFIEIYDTWRE